MNRSLLILTCVLLAAGPCLAKTPPEKPLAPYAGIVRTVESEPNDTCLQAAAVIMGEPTSASIDPAGDVDWFVFTIVDETNVLVETYPGAGQTGGDTELTIFADDCVTQLAYDDDGGDGLYSRLGYHVVPGTYFVMVNEYGNNGIIGAYVLDVIPAPAPPSNNDCNGAIDLQVQGAAVFEIDLCDYDNLYTPAEPECTNDYAANGPDALYKIELAVGEQFVVCEAPSAGFIDLSIWLASDCEDPANSCVAGDDSGNPECLSYTAATAGWYFLVVDAYSGCGLVTVSIDSPMGNAEAAWGTIKSIYR